MAKKEQQIALEEQFGRIPPQAPELEVAVLGEIMVEEDAEFDVADILHPDVFYDERHKKIYQAIQDLFANHQKVDMLTVIEQLRRNNDLEAVGGPYYVSKLTENVGSAAHLEFHAKILVQKYIQRELIKISSEIQTKSYDASIDVDDLLDFSERRLFDLAYGNIKGESKHIKSVLKETIEELEELSKKEDTLTGVPTGFSELDRITGGWQPSDLVIVAARPSMGKTAFVLSMARNMAVDYHKSVAIFSLEMPASQLVKRLISMQAEVSSQKLRTGKLSDDEWLALSEKIEPLNDANIIIDDTPQTSIFELRAKARRLKMKYDIDILIVDYLQLMTASGDYKNSREQEVSQISRGLKAVAKELNIPVIALSQLNRSVEMRSGDKRPQLSDLRESGAIEQDADLVVFIHRPEQYGLKEDSEGNSTEGLAEIIIAKHRNGALADVRLHFAKEFTKFEEYEKVDISDLVDSGLEVQTLGSKMNDDNDFNFDSGMQPGGNDFNPLSSGDFMPNSGFEDETPF